MKKEMVSATNRKGQSQEFLVEEYEDRIVLRSYISENIEDVDIPDLINEKPVTQIGGDCFFGHREILHVAYPNTLEFIDCQAFALCNGIRELILPDSITEISSFAFRDCKALKRIKLPERLRVLRPSVFSFCYLPDDVDIILNDGLEEIETHVFYSGGLNCFTLRIPESVKTISPGAFEPGMEIITSLPRDEAWFKTEL